MSSLGTLVCRVLDLKFTISSLGCRVQGSGFRIQGSGFRVHGSGFRNDLVLIQDILRELGQLDLIEGIGFGVWGLGFWVEGLGLGVWGLGFRV